MDAFGLCKHGTDQCANSLTQRLAYDYGSRGFIDEQVEASIELYRRKRNLMEDAMKRHFPSEAHWVHPSGGFFVWVRLPESVDTEALLPMVIEKEKRLSSPVLHSTTTQRPPVHAVVVQLRVG